MRDGIHPEYVVCTVTCSCGQRFQTRSTKPQIHVEICSSCHPVFTGKQKLMDIAGRVDKFNRKYGKTEKKA
jgi:large subunit ribosomal protein L31